MTDKRSAANEEASLRSSPLEPAPRQSGTILRLNVDAGFGYVHDERKQNAFIFILGKAIRFADARGLEVGERVSFRVDSQGRVSELLREQT